MKDYRLKNGYTGREVEVMKAHNIFAQFVKVSDNEYYNLRNVYNNSRKPCYKIVTRVQDGKRFNVNMNNGIAYLTTL